MQTHALLFIQDLAVIMLIAGVITILCHRFRQPVVLGYIIAGIIIGPYTPPFSYIHDESTIRTLAEVGVIFLMFALGLEFDLHKLRKVGVAAITAALAEIILMMWVGYEIGRLFGWSDLDAIFLGAILAISSTTIIIKALEELGLKKEKFAQLIFGILIIEDIFAIAILVLLSTIAVSGSFQVKDVLLTGLQLIAFLVVSLLVGILLIPRILSYIATFKNKEMLLISVLAFCFGFCLLVAKLNYSVALGAFLIGAIIAESEHLELIERLIYPLRDMFSAIFFVSVGLLFNPKVCTEHAFAILVITLVVVIGKVLSCTLGTFISGQDPKTSVRVGMGLAQIGEFSFIIASLGLTLNVTSDFLYPLAVAVSAITTFLTPYLIKYSDQITGGLAMLFPKKIKAVFEWYTTWIQHIQPKQVTQVSTLVRRSIWQIIINLVIIIAFFLAASYIAATGWLTAIQITSDRIQKTLLWGGALILSLPFLIAIYRKISALSMIIAELTVQQDFNKQFNVNIRRMIATIIPLFFFVGILLLIFALSASLLPPLEMIVFVSIVILTLAVLIYSWCVKLHAKLQIMFLETMRKKEQRKVKE